MVEKFAPWQIILITLVAHYVSRNLFLLLFLEGPDRNTVKYSSNFYRAAQILKTLDAGFLTSMAFKYEPLKSFMSVLLSAYFAFFPDQAEAVTKKYRVTPTVEVMRISWEKSTHPLIKLLARLHTPNIKVIKEFELPRYCEGHTACTVPSARTLTVKAILYYDGNLEELKLEKRLLLHIPGGGFVCMSPKHHHDYICILAKRLKVPILSVDYKKAPEYPYPHALNEIFDIYAVLAITKGGLLGMNMDQEELIIAMMGDSAGANLMTGSVLKALHTDYLTTPHAMVMIYPFLNYDIQGWLHNEYKHLLGKKTALKRRLSRIPEKPPPQLISLTVPSDLDIGNPKGYQVATLDIEGTSLVQPTPGVLPVPRERLSSRMKYLDDVIITPEFLIEMAHMYLGEKVNDVNPAKDIYISPIMANDDLLRLFPPVYIQVGDKDPFFDDSVILAARMKHLFSDDDSFVQLKIYPGVSHAYLQMLSILPEAKEAVSNIGTYLENVFKQDYNYRPKRPGLYKTFRRFKEQHSTSTIFDSNEFTYHETVEEFSDNKHRIKSEADLIKRKYTI
ncbi:Alpha/beta hydrolase fold-3 domain-containing protein [Rozella allomycis CSF55]|uniref:Alpha/beta hydrolase fold-3 domain-containing protein n=1 Tax=Rozella allomycis (strain CSF55) TaxID=988480 RepID=A0A075AS79_ROZAC|nr:Alpha/beta hydrolase fold-3 domain-containing protein [Rozella allomycis CSF55]|eukprot:EPZ33078.1 Alpha/beta hydrolase fold-3 domain-containing protein [Rozella allomycis CSF55]